jgi:hypothetical protein
MVNASYRFNLSNVFALTDQFKISTASPYYKKENLMKNKLIAIIEADKGTIRFWLFTDKTPITVAIL